MKRFSSQNLLLVLLNFILSSCFLKPCNNQVLGYIPLAGLEVAFPLEQQEFIFVNSENEERVFTISQEESDDTESGTVADRTTCPSGTNYYLHYYTTDLIRRSFTYDNDIITFELSTYNMDDAGSNASGALDTVNADYITIEGIFSGDHSEKMWVLANPRGNSTDENDYEKWVGGYENHNFIQDTTLLNTRFENLYSSQGTNNIIFYSKTEGLVGFVSDEELWVRK